MFIPAYLYSTDKLTDLSYALTFMLLASVGYATSDMTTAHKIVLFMVLVWAVRLGGFLFYRIRKQKRDKRFDEMRGSLIKFGRFWLLQGVSVFIVLTSSILFWRVENPTINSLSWLGLLVFLTGLVIEAIADWQKQKFSAKAKNKNRWIDVGLWSRSRHPNYLGEMLVWTGVYVFVFSSLSGAERVVGLASPLYITILLLFVSGIPLLEKAADARWGEDKEYHEYKKRVPVLLPTIFKS